MKDVFSTVAIIASIAVVIALLLMVPKGIEAGSGPVVTFDHTDPR
ncbi:hypothetical protein [Mesorhizobium tamadayense]|nr:hypothetical protein [Mesorhizobium tamadayense]